MSQRARWNHNTHFHRYLLNQFPEGIDKALDIGCELGLVSQRLATKAKTVDTLDTDRNIISRDCIAATLPMSGTSRLIF